MILIPALLVIVALSLGHCAYLFFHAETWHPLHFLAEAALIAIGVHLVRKLIDKYVK